MKLKNNTGFSFKFFIIIVLISFLVFDFFLQYNYPSNYLKGVPTDSRLNVYYAYFTTQSNYLTVFYLLFSLVYSRIYKSRTPFAVDLAVTTYISLTMIIYWTTLINSSKMSGGSFSNYTPIEWVTTLTLHLIIPCVMIITFITSCGNKYYSVVKHNKLTLFTIASYPAIYLIYQLVRGYVRYKQFGAGFIEENFWYIQNPQGQGYILQSTWYHYSDDNLNIVQEGNAELAKLYTYTMWASYFFLNIYRFSFSLKLKELVSTSTNAKQYVWTNIYCDGTKTSDQPLLTQFNSNSVPQIIFYFVLCCSFIAFLTFTLQYFYIHINNKKYFKEHKPNGEKWNEKEIKVIKWKKTEVLFFTNGFYFSQLRFIRSIILWFRLRKEYKHSTIKEVKEIFKERRLEIKEIVKQRKQNMSVYKYELISEKKYIKEIMPEIPYIDRHPFRDNIHEARIFKLMRIKGVFMNITNNDIQKYDHYQELKLSAQRRKRK